MNWLDDEYTVIEAAGQKVEFYFPFRKYNKVLLNLSGGTDSAALLFVLLEFLRTRNIILDEIRLLTGVDNYRPTSEWNATEIYLEFANQYPEQNITHEIFHYWKNGEKKKYHIEYEKELRDKEKFYAMYHGRTANPPEQEQKKIEGMWEDKSRPAEREITAEKNEQYHFWKNYFNAVPWEHIDKKFIAEIYFKNNFMKNTIYPITASCISNSGKDTDYWQKPCKKCWWCKEKYWAFNAYDGETL